jgi:hypothetical protein
MAEYVMHFDPAMINMAYCIVHIDTLKIHSCGKFSIEDSTNEGSCAKLAKHLDTFKLTDGINVTIVLESQPKCNIKTIMINGFLYMYYVLEKIDNPGIKKIVNYHAGNKIKYYKPREGDEPMPERIDKLKKGHYKTKQTVIQMAHRILIHNDETQEWKDFFKKGKVDDICDSYISSLSFIETHKLRKV